jgi:hypothetical protein
MLEAGRPLQFDGSTLSFSKKFSGEFENITVSGKFIFQN